MERGGAVRQAARSPRLGALDVLCRVDEVCREDVLSPCDARVLVRGRVREAVDRPGRATNDAVQVGALLVHAALTQRGKTQRSRWQRQTSEAPPRAYAPSPWCGTEHTLS